MNQLFLLLFFPLLANTVLMPDTPVFPAEEIVWSSQRRLSWDDFKATPENRGFTGAITYATIKATPKVTGFFNNQIEVEVEAIFRCDKSWAKDKARESEYLLNHEQRHFDIAEMYARKIRRALEQHNITPRNYPQVKKEVIEPLFKEYVQHDESYDHSTAHGLRSAVQEEWDDQLDTELGLMEEVLTDK